MTEVARGDPTKEFFVDMITRDISLEDCLFDLVDNSIDGAKKELVRTKKKPMSEPYRGFHCNLLLKSDIFEISDNCGGISVAEARDYAFRFGRDPKRPKDAEYGIGLYGIGMKRAMFKLGELIQVDSSTSEGSFSIVVPVKEWLTKKHWDFDMDVGKPKSVGTTMTARTLRSGVAAELGDESFQNKLRRDMSRDYSLFLQKGFELHVNGKRVAPYIFQIRTSDDIKPFSVNYEDEGVKVRIVAGLAGLPGEDFENPEDIKRTSDEYWGWFVICNDRVVLAADKSNRTVWGDEVNDEFQQWHPQYNSFMGIVEFAAEDPKLLPWTTTKREIETTSPLYRRAIVKMRKATAEFISYTNARKGDLEAAKQAEAQTKFVAISSVEDSPRFVAPAIKARPTQRYTTVVYQRPVSELTKVKESLGDKYMSNKDAGLKTYKYYFENEVK